MERVRLTDKGNKSAQELAAFLRTVADKIDQGSLTLTQGRKSLKLRLPGRFGFRFKVKDEITDTGTHRKVQIGFRWWIHWFGWWHKRRTRKGAEDMTLS